MLKNLAALGLIIVNILILITAVSKTRIVPERLTCKIGLKTKHSRQILLGYSLRQSSFWLHVRLIMEIVKYIKVIIPGLRRTKKC